MMPPVLDQQEPNMDQHRPDLGSTWAPHRPNVAPNMSQERRVLLGLDTRPKKNTPFLAQHRLNIVSTWAQKGPETKSLFSSLTQKSLYSAIRFTHNCLLHFMYSHVAKIAMHSLPAKTKYAFMSMTPAGLWKDSQQGFGPWGIVFANSIQKLRANV